MDGAFYPVQERLGDGMRSGDDQVFIVDISGGLGHGFEELKIKCSAVTTTGRLILQELQKAAERA